MAMISVPKFFALKSVYNNKYLRYLNEEGEVNKLLQFSGEEVVSPYVKFEAEKAKIGKGFVHLRCCFNNKYWVRSEANGYTTCASADEPEEDRSKVSCTLFEPLFIDAKPLRFRYVQNGNYACLWRTGAPFTNSIVTSYATEDGAKCAIFTIIDWESLTVLPKHIAFKGDNGLYLSARTINGKPFHQYASNEIGDPWVDGGILAELYPTLYAISKQRYATIKECLIYAPAAQWNLTFRRALNEDEQHDLLILLAIIGPPSALLANSPDNRVWLPDPLGKFSVKTCYLAFTRTIPLIPYPKDFIWNKRVPSKVSFFLWTAAADKSLTMVNLRKRGRIIIDGCLFCKSHSETIDHLLLHCSFSWQVWSTFFPSSDWYWVMPGSLLALAYCWKAVARWSDKTKYLWSLLPAAICWTLWLERNSRVFKGIYNSLDRVCNNVRGFLFLWAQRSIDCNDLRFQQLVFDWDELFFPS